MDATRKTIDALKALPYDAARAAAIAHLEAQLAAPRYAVVESDLGESRTVATYATRAEAEAYAAMRQEDNDGALVSVVER